MFLNEKIIPRINTCGEKIMEKDLFPNNVSLPSKIQIFVPVESLREAHQRAPPAFFYQDFFFCSKISIWIKAKTAMTNTAPMMIHRFIPNNLSRVILPR